MLADAIVVETDNIIERIMKKLEASNDALQAEIASIHAEAAQRVADAVASATGRRDSLLSDLFRARIAGSLAIGGLPAIRKEVVTLPGIERSRAKSATGPQPGMARAIIVELLGAANGPVKAATLADAVQAKGLTRSAAEKVFGRMLAANQIRREDEGFVLIKTVAGEEERRESG